MRILIIGKCVQLDLETSKKIKYIELLSCSSDERKQCLSVFLFILYWTKNELKCFCVYLPLSALLWELTTQNSVAVYIPSNLNFVLLL